MVFVRVHRFAVEVLGASDPQVAVQRETYEAAVESAAGGAVQVHRFGVEVLAKVASDVGVSRETYEAAVDSAAGGAVILHRFGIEVLGKFDTEVALSRETYEAAIESALGGAIRMHRFGLEVLAQRGIPNPVPRTLASDLDFFCHNWVDGCRVETTYMTDVIRSPDTLAEERTSLQQRPTRTMTVAWLRGSIDEVRRMLTWLRRSTRENLQIPLYPDVVDILGAVSSFDVTIIADVSKRRFFAGARVVMFQKARSYVGTASAVVRTIESLTGSSLTFTASVGTAMTAGNWSVVPLIDAEQALLAEPVQLTRSVWRVNMTVREYRGRSALGPISIGLPDGWHTALGKPIWEIEPDWSSGVLTQYIRHGSEETIGRRLTPIADGDREVQAQEWPLGPMSRENYWRVASFFDSRRGRAESFWALDREWFWTVLGIPSGFIDVDTTGTFSDFDTLWDEDGIAAAVVTLDGSIHLVEIAAVSDNGSTWRLTIEGGQSLPGALVLGDIVRLTRARKTRFESDAMVEVWAATEVVEQLTLSTIETMDDNAIDVDPNAP